MVTTLLQHLQISCQTGRFAGDVDHTLHTIIDNLSQCFWVDAISRRVQHDKIRTFFDGIQHLQHITCQELTVGKPIKLCIFSCCLYCLFHNLHTDYFLRHRSKYLSNRTGSAIEIENHLVLRLAHIGSGCVIEYFCAQRIGLEEGESRNAEFQP